MVIEIDKNGRQSVKTPNNRKASKRELTEVQKAKIEILAEQAAERIMKRLKARHHEIKNQQREDIRSAIKGEAKNELFKIQGNHIRAASREEAEEIATEILSGSESFKRNLMNEGQLCYGTGTIPELMTF